VATVRSWREVVASIEHMKRIPGQDEAGRIETGVHPALLWWMENFALIRDIATRRYAAHVTTYQRILDDPDKEVDVVLRWLGKGNRAAALRAIDTELHHHEGAPTPDGLDPQHVRMFDDFYEALHDGGDLTPALVRDLNQTDIELRPRLMEAREQMRRKLIEGLVGAYV